MHKTLMAFRLVLATMLAVAVCGGAAHAIARKPWTPPADTVVKVEGNARDGFGVYYHDGSSIFPPTDSEARAECEEYDTRIAVVRCKTEVRTWYRDLATLRRALRYAHVYGR